ncbi:MAG TPA: type II toxin-antitoxin system VapC family toxin [Tepidiformaceae bacterium]|nr:type II toxin-antitoxin system VapC family toxin [Tepidiformaceae bacterium]HMO96425.1 type II toxin-antitoxin system VapC family toxin [Tepidiformaceae bacterium]
MIVVDTHVWIWWVTGARSLSRRQVASLRDAPEVGLSAISVWEVAKKAERQKLDLDRPLDEWLDQALGHSKLRLIPLSPEISLISTRLPEGFHSDPADQIIVATALVLNAELLTSDSRILAYPHVTTIR